MSEPKQRPFRSRQDYGTPPELLAAVKAYLRIAEFDCDLAASPSNAVCARYFTEADNALVQPWKQGDGYNWLNPPFATIGPWVERAWWQLCASRAQTVMLVPAAVGSNWWRDWVDDNAYVKFLNPRLTFVGCKDPYPKDCALLVYERRVFEDGPSYEVWTWKGRRDPPVASTQA
jgi:phage N-6-adenine-methyltransferase